MPRLSRVASVVGLVTFVAAAVAGSGQFCDRRLPHGLTRPGLAMQLAASREDVEQVTGMKVWCPGVAPPGAWPDCLANAETLRAQQWRDFAFIPLYVAFLVLAALLGWRSGHGGRVIATLGIVAVVVAALADVRENLVILTILGPYPVCDAMPRPWALLKWRLLTLALLAVVVPLVRAERDVRGLARWAGHAAAVLAVSTVYFTGSQLLWGDDTYLESALPTLAATVVMTWVAVCGRAWFPGGLLAGLDALARRPGFRRIAAWPPTQ